MKIKLSTVIAVSIIVLLFAGVAYAVTSGSAAQAKQRGKAQHEAISSESFREDYGSKSETHEKGNGHADRNKKKADSKNHDGCNCDDCEEHEHTIINLQGKITEVDLAEGNSFKIEAQDGKIYEVEVGPPWFWNEKGIAIAEGDNLIIEVIEKEEDRGDNYAAVTIKNLTTSKTATLRNPEGEPLWKNCD